ncbi:Auxin Efflux Carrier [Leptothrix cholodnii SP-6]|uniref:Auxin Efflux Carrier n=1 Tax=Leptothrix cholodnii (strain ATCC 51168 / LMG 8142 / SP-6) TaxID=395495 RepID=B1XW73_LEPCP|nr:AEC family transporter [Leptothrix cholodnii]ACB32600.1 Auxin Efflux Carrier [Leptothrix cholodnii SP-6]
MQAIFSVTVPFFALILAGYLAARRRILPLDAVPGLNAFVLYFALPCLLFRFGSTLPVRELFDPVVLGVYLLCALVIVGFTIAVTLKSPVGLKDAAFGALVAAFPNSGFMGVPLLVALVGQAAAGPVITAVMADMIITSSLCIAIAQAHQERHTQPPSQIDDVTSTLPPGVELVRTPGATAETRAAVLRSLRAAFGNPLPWSIGLGALASATGLSLPGPLASVVGMLANAASPVALFTIGAVLWRAGQPHAPVAVNGMAVVRPPLATPLARYLPVALIKLLLHPLLVLLVGLAARGLGAPLSSFQLMVLVLTAALPSASNVSLLAERYGADNGRIARIILASTVLAFGSFSALAWLFGVQPV